MAGIAEGGVVGRLEHTEPPRKPARVVDEQTEQGRDHPRDEHHDEVRNQEGDPQEDLHAALA
jgi:hypothetical protein